MKTNVTKQLSLVLTFVCLCLIGTTITSCSSDDDVKSYKKAVTLNAGETFVIEKNSEWKSANLFVASVKDNVITANCVGKTQVVSPDGKIDVAVKATNFMFEEPSLKWGASKSEIKSYMKGCTLTKEDSKGLGYEGKGFVYAYVYLFEENKLETSSMYIPARYVDLSTDFLKQRYYPISADDDFVYLIDPLQETFVGVTAQALGSNVYVLVIYEKYTNDKNNTRFNSLKKAFGKRTYSAEEKNVIKLLKQKFSK